MRLFRADLGLESPSYGKGRSRVFHPSPPTPLPFQGRGVPVRFTLQPKTQNPPLAPIGGEGSGVRGNTTPKHDATARRKSHTPLPCISTANSVTTGLSVVSKTPLTHHIAGRISGWKARATGRAAAGCFTPHPRPLSPSGGEGCQCTSPLKNTNRPPAFHP